MRENIEHFLEILVTQAQVLEKQEQMHEELIELRERMERERIIREEAWRQQEMERIKEMKRHDPRRRLATYLSFPSLRVSRARTSKLPSHQQSHAWKENGDKPIREGIKFDVNNKEDGRKLKFKHSSCS